MHSKKLKIYINKIKEILFINSLNKFLTILLISTIFLLFLDAFYKSININFFLINKFIYYLH